MDTTESRITVIKFDEGVVIRFEKSQLTEYGEIQVLKSEILPIIERAASRYSQDVLFGAGSMLDAESARAAILAGAQFILSPSFKSTLVEICRRYSTPVIPGAFTATEVLTAWECGADMVKIFPASLGGPALIKALKAPLPQVELVPVGGVNLETAADFVRAGAAAVGVGSALINQKLLEAGDWATLTERAQRFLEQIARGRA